MYSNESILTLSKRIGFGVPSEALRIDFSEDIVTGTSGRTFRFFHQLVDLYNIYLTVEECDMEQEPFELYLQQMRFDATKSVLSKSLDQSSCYDANVDYNDIITSKTGILEEAIGYAVAITFLEQMISSKRSNLAEINANLSYEKLKLELNGFKSDKGVVVATGLKGQLDNLIRGLRKGFCSGSNDVTVNNASVW